MYQYRSLLFLIFLIWLVPVVSGCSDSSSRAVVNTDPPPPPPDGGEQPPEEPVPPEPSPTNILLVILDDVGVDQLSAFGYGGAGSDGLPPPSTPTIDTIASAGLRFRNTWSMPECSPGRTALLTGRYPLRNNVFQAIGPNDLANSQLTPYDITVAKLLKNADYTSAMFGKFHLAGPENNEAGNGTPMQLGWDHFYGWTGGLPASIDTTAGGVAELGTYSCGFVPDRGADVNGADFGACYFAPQHQTDCTMIHGNNEFGDSPGQQCLTLGGILVPEATTCENSPPAELRFDRENAHYVSPLVINDSRGVLEAAVSDPRGRGHRSTIEVNAAIDWIKSRANSDQPWMATVSFSAVHTPFQPPPGALLPSGIGAQLTADCSNQLNQRLISDAMTEAMDTELGRLLVETGLAHRDSSGNLVYEPEATNTLIVIVGDNGTFGTVVKFPFDPTRAKGGAYQTGVWVPLVVAGPVVTAPNRDVEHMVNITDVFQLMAETADIDVAVAVPGPIDSVTLQPYLEDSGALSQRAFNFTQGGLNLQTNGGRNGPCVLGNSCSHTPVSKSVCEDNGGVWWGMGADLEKVIRGDLEQCWQVNQAIYQEDPENYETNRIAMAWTTFQAIRNDAFKLVRNHSLDYDISTNTGVDVESEELYLIDQGTPNPRLDRAGENLLDGSLTQHQQDNYLALAMELDNLLASQVSCPGDGNSDGEVNQEDLDNYQAISARWGKSSSYDFNLDGLTDAADEEIIFANLGVCGS
ncbi:MAG: sulfatase-like hydrolase/transferase [Porticoccaceae bacterium]